MFGPDSFRWRWLIQDLAEIPTFARMSLALRRASADGRETCATLAVRQAERLGDRPALRFESETLSFAELNRGANRVAHLLRREGVSRGDVFALMMQNSPAFLMAEVAAAKLGAVAALVNHHLVGAALEHALAAASPKVVLADEAAVPALASILVPAPVFAEGPVEGLPPGFQSLDDACAASDTHEPALADLRGGDVFLYIYTSGTTGYPKPAIIRHMRFTMGGIALSALFGIGSDDCVYAPLPLYHGQSNFVGFAVALRAGACFASRRAFSAREFLPDVRRHGATMFVYVGELCRYLLAQPPAATDRDHRLRVAAGAGLRPDVWRAFQERFGVARIFEMYGATEANVTMMNRANRAGSVGRPYPFQHAGARLARVDAATGELARDERGFAIPCRDGQPGELLGRVGKGLIAYDGYVDREQSERKLVRGAFRAGDAWFRTGDLLTRDRDGYYFFVDRLGDTFRWKGENVSTQEVADILNRCTGIAESTVYGVAVPGADGRAGMAALVLEPGSELEPWRLWSEVDASLPGYARPVFVRLVPSLSVTGTLKQRKVELKGEGYDPALVSDPLYVRDDSSRCYVPLGAEIADAIRSGLRRL